MNQFASGFLYTIIAYGTPLILCSLGGMMTGLSGRFNLGMEGMMLFAAFFTAVFDDTLRSPKRLLDSQATFAFHDRLPFALAAKQAAP